MLQITLIYKAMQKVVFFSLVRFVFPCPISLTRPFQIVDLGFFLSVSSFVQHTTVEMFQSMPWWSSTIQTSTRSFIFVCWFFWTDVCLAQSSLPAWSKKRQHEHLSSYWTGYNLDMTSSGRSLGSVRLSESIASSLSSIDLLPFPSLGWNFRRWD